MVAGDEHERVAEVGHPAHDLGLQRRAAVGEVAGEEQRVLAGRSFQDRLREEVVVEVGGDRDARTVRERRQAGRVGDQAGEADELRVELLVEGSCAVLRGLDGIQRARDVGAEGVVLGLVDVAARGEEDHEADADADGRDQAGGDGVAESRAGAVPDGERDQQPDREAAEQGEADQLLEVARDRVPRLASNGLQRQRSAVGDPAHDAAVDGSEVDVEPDRQPDRVLEADAPVHQRDVEIQRPVAPGVGRQLDLAH